MQEQDSNTSLNRRAVGRKDSWSKEDDEILVNLVFKHIESGSTQTNAFLEAEVRLGRTKSACGFRWNNKLRIIYDERIRETKISKRLTARARTLRYGSRSTWSLEQDKIILQFILDGINMGRKIRDSIRLAAAHLDKNENSCMIRWTNVVRPDHISEYLEAKKRYKDSMVLFGNSWDENKVERVIHNLELKIHELTKEIRHMKENYVEKCDCLRCELNCLSIVQKKDEL
ncbi:hypothetical protein ACOMCU_01085 [Lysinibacillus sp. UGB7]|uniref:hypothetical protein n=1 Tax=Lysinibacillus sp. UGB7 TaxID=3411039 RepID=UPI003B7C1D60